MSITGYQLILTLTLIGACIGCILIVFVFGRKLQASAYLRDSLVEGVFIKEFRSLLLELDDRRAQGSLDPANSAPERPYPSTYFGNSWGDDDGAIETDEQKLDRLKQIKELEKEYKDKETTFNEWRKEENKRYNVLKSEAEIIARKKAEKLVPHSFDVSVLGGGFSFLLEFSTVIVIIFTILILGMLSVMEGSDIATILASIAGYVLGKANAGAAATKSTGENNSVADSEPIREAVEKG